MTYAKPTKRIVLDEHLELFKESVTFNTILQYIERLNGAVVDVKLTDEVHMSAGVRKVLGLLDKVDGIVEQTPPIDNKQSRFGNPGFRTFLDKVVEVGERSAHNTAYDAHCAHRPVQRCTLNWKSTAMPSKRYQHT